MSWEGQDILVDSAISAERKNICDFLFDLLCADPILKTGLL